MSWLFTKNDVFTVRFLMQETTEPAMVSKLYHMNMEIFSLMHIYRRDHEGSRHS